MAKNWTVAQAYKALLDGNKSAVMDFGKRFPMATLALTQATGADLLVSGLPTHVTMRKLDAALKDGVDPVEDEEEDNKPAKEAPAKKSTGKRGRPSKAATKPIEDEEEDEEEDDNPYAGMTAVELFKACKKRGITCQPKQKTDVYIELLKAADQEAEDEEEDEDEEDTWEDEVEEEVEEKPKKSAKKETAKKSAKKEKHAKKEEAEDEEDDWDI